MARQKKKRAPQPRIHGRSPRTSRTTTPAETIELLSATAEELCPGVDIRSIALMAVRSRPPQVPDEIVQAELRARGVAGSYGTSAVFRRLNDLTLQVACDMLALTGSATSITAGMIWEQYRTGRNQTEAAARLGVTGAAFGARSRELGFEMEFDVDSHRRYRVLRGPCADCGRILNARQLSADGYCNSCEEATSG